MQRPRVPLRTRLLHVAEGQSALALAVLPSCGVSSPAAAVESGSEAGWFSVTGKRLIFGKKSDFFLRTLIRQDAVKLIASACLWRRRHHKKCPTDRKTVQ